MSAAIRIILAYAFLSCSFGFIYGGDRALQVGTAAGGGLLIAVFLIWLLYVHCEYKRKYKYERSGSYERSLYEYTPIAPCTQKPTMKQLVHITPDLRYYLHDLTKGTANVPDDLTLIIRFGVHKPNRSFLLGPRFTFESITPRIISCYFKTGPTVSDIISDLHTVESAFFDDIFSISGASLPGSWSQT